MRAKPILYTIIFSVACLFASTSKAGAVAYEEILQHVGENLPAGWKMQETPNGIFPNTRDNLRKLTESLPASTSVLPGTFAHKAAAIITAWQYQPQLWQSDYCFHDGMAVLANVITGLWLRCCRASSFLMWWPRKSAPYQTLAGVMMRGHLHPTFIANNWIETPKP